MFKAHLVMIQRKSANLNPYARETEKGPRPDLVLVLVEMFKAHLVMIQRNLVLVEKFKAHLVMI